MHVHVVDPSAFTPPYDHALCRALATAGADVKLYTSRFAYGAVPPPEGYQRHETFYRAARFVHGPRARRLVKLAEHVPDMLSYRRLARAADVVHFQWLTVQHLDGCLLPTDRFAAAAHRPLVLTAHDVLPREPRPGQRGAQRRLYEHFDAIVVHSEQGRKRLTDELGIDPGRVHVIPHGVLRPWEQTRQDLATQAELARPDEEGAPTWPADGPVALFFGLLRPYKGLDLLLDAWRELESDSANGAQLWIVGMPRMDLAPLRAAAPPGVRFLPRFVSDPEILTLMRRASLVVLPYREIDQSGVAFTALGAGVPLVLSDAGGFPEIAATGAARTFAAGDAPALCEVLRETLGDPTALAAMAKRARAAADGPYCWDTIARRTLDLYEALLREDPRR